MLKETYIPSIFQAVDNESVNLANTLGW